MLERRKDKFDAGKPDERIEAEESLALHSGSLILPFHTCLLASATPKPKRKCYRVVSRIV